MPPGDVRHVDHAVDVAGQADEQAELGRVLDLALDHGADRVLLGEFFPRVALGLLETERDAALVAVDLEHHHVDLLRGRDDLARVHVLLGPAHLGDVDQALDARLELDEGAVLGDVGDGAADLGADRILGGHAFPRIALELLHAEADALRVGVDADDLHLHHVADVDHLGRVVDALVAHVGDVEQAVDAAEVDERTVVGDVLHHAVDHLALGQLVDQLAALLGARLFEDRAARDDDVAAAAVHLQDLERLRHVHQRGHVADRADVDLRAGEECHGAIEVDGEAALDAAEDAALDALALAEFGFELVPRSLAAGTVAAQHRLALGVLDAVYEHFDLVADVQRAFLIAAGEFAQRNAAFALEADVDQRDAVFDRGDGALDDAAFEAALGATELFIEEFREIFARGVGSGSHKGEVPDLTFSGQAVVSAGLCGRTAREAPCRRRHPPGSCRNESGNGLQQR